MANPTSMEPVKITSAAESSASKVSMEGELADEELRRFEKDAFGSGTVEATLEASRIEDSRLVEEKSHSEEEEEEKKKQ